MGSLYRIVVVDGALRDRLRNARNGVDRCGPDRLAPNWVLGPRTYFFLEPALAGAVARSLPWWRHACAADASDTEASGTDEAAISSNADARKVLVYSNNVENMLFDWKDLLSYMKTQASRPDIFLVQQMTDRAHLDEMTKAMTNVLGASYSGRVAQDHPTNLRQGTEVNPRPTVTTGIIFRSARFTVLSEEVWFPFGGPNATTGAPDCTVRHASSSYQTIKLRLHDKVAARNLTVVSLRHPTGTPCAAENIADIDSQLPANEDLSIVGGDFNDNPTETKVNGT
jgi:hypothetical protein